MVDEKISKYISYILRHNPDAINIKLDSHGWAKVDDLLKGINKSYVLSFDELKEIVRCDEKQRYSFNEDYTLVRANQGHSIDVNLDLEEQEPPTVLFHGTASKNIDSIKQFGLMKMSRQYVHLSESYDVALNVGKRHGIPVVFAIQAYKMKNDGFSFFKSVNNVWLTKNVPIKYLEICNCQDIKDISKEIIDSFQSKTYDVVQEWIIPKYGWKTVEGALQYILLDNNRLWTDYSNVADVYWDAIVDGYDIDKNITVALLYYRLGNRDKPYDNNVIWSITSKLYDIDYCDSQYNPLEDGKIISILKAYKLIQ